MKIKDALRGTFVFDLKKLIGFLNTLDSVEIEDLDITYKEVMAIKKASSAVESLGIIEPEENYEIFFREFIND